MKSPKKISQNELLQVFKDKKNHADGGMCFLLGAGASVNSNIPSGSKLAFEWYQELKWVFSDNDLQKWQNDIPDFNENKLAEFYPQIFEKRFANHPLTGFYNLQDHMKDAEPSIGYSFLAQVLDKTQHKIVITTNFDHMIEDAIRIFTKKGRPLVCGHESLAEYIDSHPIRPTIIKVHRDLLLHPFSKASNVDKLKDAWEKTLDPILKTII